MITRLSEKWVCQFLVTLTFYFQWKVKVKQKISPHIYCKAIGKKVWRGQKHAHFYIASWIVAFNCSLGVSPSLLVPVPRQGTLNTSQRKLSQLSSSSLFFFLFYRFAYSLQFSLNSPQFSFLDFQGGGGPSSYFLSCFKSFTYLFLNVCFTKPCQFKLRFFLFLFFKLRRACTFSIWMQDQASLGWLPVTGLVARSVVFWGIWSLVFWDCTDPELLNTAMYSCASLGVILEINPFCEF